MDHLSLFIPGPVEVRRETLEAQSRWLVGHRSPEFFELFARVQGKLRRVFQTQSRVYAISGSGTGFWEGAVRCGVRDEHPILHLDNGIFGARWAKVSRANGKHVHTLHADFGQAIKPEQVAAKLRQRHYDAVAVVYNETSTGVLNPVRQIAQVVHAHPDTLLFVDAVSAVAAAPLPTDAWGIDVVVASPQKAIAMPPGLGFAAVSDRVLQRAQSIPHRGWVFDFLLLEEGMQKNATPATPNVSLFYAADTQLDHVLAEGLEARIARHEQMAQTTRDWALKAGFGLFAEAGFRSPTVSVIQNEPGPGVPFAALDAYLRERGYLIANGYGPIKQKTFRIAHMGDVQPAQLQTLLDIITDFLEQA